MLFHTIFPSLSQRSSRTESSLQQSSVASSRVIRMLKYLFDVWQLSTHQHGGVGALLLKIVQRTAQILA
jgi:hypothetical protein